jgi:phage terminase small subunit
MVANVVIPMTNEALNQCTPDEALFVYEYLKDRNKSKAALRCGKPEKWAGTYGHRMYRRPHVRQAIDEAVGLICEELKIDATWVLRQLIDLYEMDMNEVIKVNALGEPEFDFTNASPEVLSMIEQIDISPGKYGTKISVKLPSKHKLLETIGKHVSVNAYKDHVEHSGAVTVIFDDQDKDGF